MSMEMPNFPQMRREWLVWRAVCRELEDLGVDINKTDTLHAAMRLWGEELVALRWYQDEFDTVGKALDEARAGYAKRLEELEAAGRIP